MHHSLRAVLVVLLPVPTAVARGETRVTRDIEYARVGEQSLQLDLFVPSAGLKHLLPVQVHGGAWRAGSKSDMPPGKLVAQGFPVASVEFRLSTGAPFPTQIHDLKAALCFLRAKGSDFGVDSRQIAIIGESAGGHLAALVGVANPWPVPTISLRHLGPPELSEVLPVRSRLRPRRQSESARGLAHSRTLPRIASTVAVAANHLNSPTYALPSPRPRALRIRRLPRRPCRRSPAQHRHHLRR